MQPSKLFRNSIVSLQKSLQRKSTGLPPLPPTQSSVPSKLPTNLAAETLDQDGLEIDESMLHLTDQAKRGDTTAQFNLGLQYYFKFPRKGYSIVRGGVYALRT